jgi:hypothetical protein
MGLDLQPAVRAESVRAGLTASGQIGGATLLGFEGVHLVPALLAHRAALGQLKAPRQLFSVAAIPSSQIRRGEQGRSERLPAVGNR